MQLARTEGTRGIALMLDLTLDRLVMPAAIVVALGVATLMGGHLGNGLAPAAVQPHQL